MARTTIIQSNLTVGELSPDMWARIDNEMYYAGVAKAQNVVIMPHGGLRRRPGLTKAADSLLSGDGKLFAFEFSTIQDYVIHLAPGEFSVYRDGALQVTVTDGVPYLTVEECKEVDVIQSGDIMVLTHPDYAPRLIQRQGDHDLWNMIVMPLYNIPTYNYNQTPYLYVNDGTTTDVVTVLVGESVFNDAGDKHIYTAKVVRTGIDLTTEDFSNTTNWTDAGLGEEPVWSDSRGWPAVCTFFQARLWLAGSPSNPNSIWSSKINGFFDFDTGTGQDDYGIFDTLDTEQYNRITNLFPGRNLMVFTTGSEFYQTASLVTPSTSSWKRSTGYGSKRIRPTMVDGAVLFVDRIGRTVRSAVYVFQEDAYHSPSISVPSEHLIRDVVSMDSVKGTNIDVSDFVYIINSDGTMAVLNTLRNQGTEGWTEWTTWEGSVDGGFRDVVAVNNIVWFMCERQGEFHLEYMNEGTTTDHNTFGQGEAPETFNVTHNGDNVVHNGENVIFTDYGTGVPITEAPVNQSTVMAAQTYKLILDKSIMDDVQGSTTTITLPRPSYDIEVGLDVELLVTTMPMNVPAQDGATRNDRKRVIRAMLNMRDSLGVFANANYAPDRKFTVALDETPTPYTGLKEIYLLGHNRETQLEIYQENPLPFKILGLGYEIEIGDN